MGEQPAKRWTQRPEGSTWGDWGDDDELGRVNLMGPAKVLEGVREVRAGISFCLSLPLDYPGGTALNQRRYPPRLAPTEDMDGTPDVFFNIHQSLHAGVVGFASGIPCLRRPMPTGKHDQLIGLPEGGRIGGGRDEEFRVFRPGYAELVPLFERPAVAKHHDAPGVVAQVAAGLAQQEDAGRTRLRHATTPPRAAGPSRPCPSPSAAAGRRGSRSSGT